MFWYPAVLTFFCITLAGSLVDCGFDCACLVPAFGLVFVFVQLFAPTALDKFQLFKFPDSKSSEKIVAALENGSRAIIKKKINRLAFFLFMISFIKSSTFLESIIAF